MGRFHPATRYTLAEQEDIATTPPSDDSFSERKMRTSEYMVTDKNGNLKKDKFTFVDVAPAGFEHLRSVCGMTIADYLDTLCGLPLTGGAVGEGKSGQFFFFSADRTVMLKVCVLGGGVGSPRGFARNSPLSN